MKKNNSNIFRLVVYLNNKDHSRDFKTTHSYKDVKTIDDAFSIIDTFFSSNSKHIEGNTIYSDVNFAYYNGKLFIKDGKTLNK